MTFDDVARIAAELPDVTEAESRGNRSWSVSGQAIAWERPFSKADIKRFGVLDLGEKEAALAAHPTAFFTIPHFDGYSAVLIQLKKVSKKALREAIVDGWLASAPAKLTDEYLAK